MIIKRVFLIVLDSFGIGDMPDAGNYGDEGANTIKSVAGCSTFSAENMRKMGLFNIDGVEAGKKYDKPIASYARLLELSKGKDTTTGHWEIAGIVSKKPFPTYPNGFGKNIISEFSKRCGRKILCNKPYSGTEVINDYGEEHLKTGSLIVYTSADSVFQIAAHDSIVPIDELYRYCKIARELLTGENAVGRVIARPFSGKPKEFYRLPQRHDFSLEPPEDTILDYIKKAGKEVIAVGKINDIFAGKGITSSNPTKNNKEGIDKLSELADKDFEGLCFVNLVDFDMLYGHRNDRKGYSNAISYFDLRLEEIKNKMRADDVLMITADHGCDPCYKGTDHTREYIPLLVYSQSLKRVNLGTLEGFDYIGGTVCDMLNVGYKNKKSFLKKIRKQEDNYE